MPGKHAPPSPVSFIASLTRAAAFALAILGLIVLIAVVAVTSRDGDQQASPQGSRSPTGTATGGAPTPTATATVSPTPTRTVLPRTKVTVAVLNGNRVAGLAGRTSDELEDDGYKVGEPGNAETTGTTTIYFKPGRKAEAQILRKRHFEWLGADRLKQATDDLPDALLVVVLGTDHPDA